MSEENKDRIIQDFATNLIRLGNECRDHALENARLNAEVDQLVHKVNYWRIEAETDNARWLRCLEDKERLTKAGDEMALNLTHIGWNICVEAWNAAKEGKQS
jgi:hypothetical protein